MIGSRKTTPIENRNPHVQFCERKLVDRRLKAVKTSLPDHFVLILENEMFWLFLADSGQNQNKNTRGFWSFDCLLIQWIFPFFNVNFQRIMIVGLNFLYKRMEGKIRVAKRDFSSIVKRHTQVPLPAKMLVCALLEEWNFHLPNRLAFVWFFFKNDLWPPPPLRGLSSWARVQCHHCISVDFFLLKTLLSIDKCQEDD